MTIGALLRSSARALPWFVLGFSRAAFAAFLWIVLACGALMFAIGVGIYVAEMMGVPPSKLITSE